MVEKAQETVTIPKAEYEKLRKTQAIRDFWARVDADTGSSEHRTHRAFMLIVDELGNAISRKAPPEEMAIILAVWEDVMSEHKKYNDQERRDSDRTVAEARERVEAAIVSLNESHARLIRRFSQPPLQI